MNELKVCKKNRKNEALFSLKLRPPDADFAIPAQISKLARWAEQPDPAQLGSKAGPGQSVWGSG